MRTEDMVCENCDYYEPWESGSPILISFRQTTPYESAWPIEVNGSCRRNPPELLPVGDESSALPVYPLFPVVCATYWCGEGRWTDPDTGARYQWGDWDE